MIMMMALVVMILRIMMTVIMMVGGKTFYLWRVFKNDHLVDGMNGMAENMLQ